MKPLFCLAIGCFFFVIGCSHIQKIHYYNSSTTAPNDVREQDVYKNSRSIGCPLLPIPWSPTSSQSKVNITDSGEEFQLGVNVNIHPLTFWKDVYWWGPLWLPIVPAFLFTKKARFEEIPIKIEYKRKWKTEFRQNDVELMHKRFEEIRESSFLRPNKVIVRFISENGKPQSIVVQADDRIFNDDDTLWYQYKFNLNQTMSADFDVDVEINNKTYSFTLKKQERWHFALYAPFYCGLN